MKKWSYAYLAYLGIYLAPMIVLSLTSLPVAEAIARVGFLHAILAIMPAGRLTGKERWTYGLPTAVAGFFLITWLFNHIAFNVQGFSADGKYGMGLLLVVPLVVLLSELASRAGKMIHENFVLWFPPRANV